MLRAVTAMLAAIHSYENRKPRFDPARDLIDSMLRSKIKYTATEIDPAELERFFPPIATGRCSVVMLDAGHKKIDVIKALREDFGLGLKEAKDIVDAVTAGKAHTLIEGTARLAETVRQKYLRLGARIVVNEAVDREGIIVKERSGYEELLKYKGASSKAMYDELKKIMESVKMEIPPDFFDTLLDDKKKR